MRYSLRVLYLANDHIQLIGCEQIFRWQLSDAIVTFLCESWILAYCKLTSYPKQSNSVVVIFVPNNCIVRKLSFLTFYFIGPVQLRCHCLYILIIAVNGITECFMFATMSQSAVDSYNQKMVLFSIVFLISSWFFTYFGAVGFIFANCLNMLLRIIHRYHLK